MTFFFWVWHSPVYIADLSAASVPTTQGLLKSITYSFRKIWRRTRSPRHFCENKDSPVYFHLFPNINPHIWCWTPRFMLIRSPNLKNSLVILQMFHIFLYCDRYSIYLVILPHVSTCFHLFPQVQRREGQALAAALHHQQFAFSPLLRRALGSGQRRHGGDPWAAGGSLWDPGEGP